MPVRRVQLIVCRHTQIDLNAQGRYSGHIDAPLNFLGHAQADQLARALAPLPIRGIYCSDLLRARTVAERIAKAHELAPQSDARLREVHLGRMDGMRKDIAEREFPDARLRTSNSAFDFRPIGGEHRPAVLERMLACCDDIARMHGTEDGRLPFVVIVSHGTALRVLLEHLGTHKFHEQGRYQVVAYSDTRS